MGMAMATETAGLYRLLAWVSPAFPTGAFSYSHGLEAFVEEGAVHDRATLEAWIGAVVVHGSGRVDADILRDAWRAAAAGDDAALAEIDRRGCAYRATAELALESSQQGAAFVAGYEAAWSDPHPPIATRRVPPSPATGRGVSLPAPSIPLPLAGEGGARSATGEGVCHAAIFGSAAARAGVGLGDALTAYFHAFAANLMSAGLRLGDHRAKRRAAHPRGVGAGNRRRTRRVSGPRNARFRLRKFRRGPRLDGARDPVQQAVPLMTLDRGPLRIGIGGPVGSGKTALMDHLCKRMRERFEIVAITNDIYTREDAEFLTRSGALPPERIRGVETGGCPHTAIREDASINLAAVAELNRLFPALDVILIESGGDNLAATFSPELADLTIYVIDVAAGDKIPRKGGPGITRSDLLVINKIDLAPLVGASLDVMDRDARRMRGERQFIFTNLKSGKGVDEIIEFVVREGGL